MRAYRALALVPAGEREALVTLEGVEQVPQIPDTHLDVAVDGARDRLPGEDVLHVLARRRQRLQDSARTGRGDDRRLEARLHPREGTHEVRVDAEGDRPAVEQRPDVARLRCQGRPCDSGDGDRTRNGGRDA